MSITAEAWAWETACPTNSAKLVLAYLGFRANHATGDAWPSIPRMVRDTGLVERTVRTALRVLMRAGLIFIEHRHGPRGECVSTRYRLALGQARQDAPPPSPDPLANDGQTPLANGADPLANGGQTPLATTPGKRDSEIPKGNRKEEPSEGAAAAASLAQPALDLGLDPPAEDTQETKPPPKRPHRLPANWQPSPADRVFAASRGMSADEVTEAVEQFRDFWHSASRGTKTDWSATWRNRVRALELQASQRAPGYGRRGPAYRNGLLEQMVAEREAGQGGYLYPDDDGADWQPPDDDDGAGPPLIEHHG